MYLVSNFIPRKVRVPVCDFCATSYRFPDVFPQDILFEHHRRHYEPGTLERFRSWFARSGHEDMLQNPFLSMPGGRLQPLQSHDLRFDRLSGARFENRSTSPWTLKFALKLGENCNSVEQLFGNFVRCTAHTHPLGDFRRHLGYYMDVLAGPRHLLFHGDGTCLLLGAMIQALASRLLDEQIDLHYSHSAARELTHIFGTWRGAYFVDADQKTWTSLTEIDHSAVFGYIFQQLGVSANLVYLSLSEFERSTLFSSMTRGYFEFYEGSAAQYMCQRYQDPADLLRLFGEARSQFCSPLSVDAADFPWKAELRRQANVHGIQRPFFHVRADEAVTVTIPAPGALRIGVEEDELPQECELLSAIFFGRVPASLSVPLPLRPLTLAEFPWLLVFDGDVTAVDVNGQRLTTQPSRCGHHRLIGMAELERVLEPERGPDGFPLEITSPGVGSVKVVFPFNAFALASGLVACSAPGADGRSVFGRFPA
jgi:hypothetical protein